MTRPLLRCSPTKITLLSSSIFRVSLLHLKCKFPSLTFPHRLHPRSNSLFCTCFHAQHSTDMDMVQYKEAFSRRMALAGLRPHHRVALGVSGGPDSMALCVLTASWKTEGPNAVGKTDGFIDGLLAVIVDHGLRTESRDEANTVRHRVSQMGIRCEITCCDWEDGRPKQGHLQEAARDMRYQLLQDVCIQNEIGVLLIAHHADDQAELFILRLSRSSGVLGLSGMAFTSQIFSKHMHYYDKNFKDPGILLVRPLMEFSKEDMYKICMGDNQDWVEDATNLNQLFARNRIRKALQKISSSICDSEIKAVMSACRKTRLYVDHICSSLLNQMVTIMNEGYALIDLETLSPSKVHDICLSKFVALVLQFISQRQRPVRGNTSKLLLSYIRTVPCKASFTAAGCFLCPHPGSKGTKVLVCCSVDHPLPSKAEPCYTYSNRVQKHHILDELESIIADGKSYSHHFVPDISEVQFLDVTSESVLNEAVRLNILSDSTRGNILLLHREEMKHFRTKAESMHVDEPKLEAECPHKFPNEPLRAGQTYYFMNRFLISWKWSNEIGSDGLSEGSRFQRGLTEKNQHVCSSCVVSNDMGVKVRHMIESDWLYLSKLSKCSSLENLKFLRPLSDSGEVEKITDKTNINLDHIRLSALRALRSLKSIPVAARRSLPVLVNHEGLILNIPSIGFQYCPCLEVTAIFRPRVPLAGGHSSFI